MNPTHTSDCATHDCATHDCAMPDVDCDADHPCRRDHTAIPRRAVLAGGAAAVAALAGCGGGGTTAPPPDPVSLSGGVECDACGMVVGEHPGPNGQVFYRDSTPAGHPAPARFDSLSACLFPYHFERERLDRSVAAVYVTDYSRVDYELTTEGDATYVSTATAAETFAPAADVTLVVGSDVHGAMGPDSLPFSETADAEAFRADHGGDLVAFDEVTPGILGR